VVCAAQQAVSARIVGHLTSRERAQLVSLLRRLLDPTRDGHAGGCDTE
jgi:DNA-binding MarR family transcriptional regulator